jgi:hypothetical protein
MGKYRYIENFPEKIDITFEDKKSFDEYYSKRLRDFIDSSIEYNKWDRKILPLNKDGNPRKYNPATHLQDKEVREKQKKAFGNYLEKKKLEKIERDNKIRLNYENALKVLINNNIDITQLKIQPRFPNF